MQVLVAFVIGLVLWVVLWSLGAKADDAALPLVVFVLIGVIMRMATPYVRELLKP